MAKRHAPTRRNKGMKNTGFILNGFIILMIVLLVMSYGQRPVYDNLIRSEQRLTLSNITDFPLMNYASLTFSEGGGLYRLYDRENLGLLQIGAVYDLTAGTPSGSRMKGAYQPASYTAVIEMISRDGTVITTAAAYQDDGRSLLFGLLGAALVAFLLGTLVWLGFLVLKMMIGLKRYRRTSP